VQLDENAGAERVAGRYRLAALVAGGGMGRVWRAYDELLDREVAVKEIRAPAGLPRLDRAQVVRETLREARAAARLDHPNVVRVFDVVQTAGQSWIVMEYVPSRSLRDVVSQDGPLPHREVARIGLSVLDALLATHAAGVLHRDVKPSNVLLTPAGRVVLADFGLAAVGAGPAGPAEPLLGSPHYIAPERLRLGVSTERSDLWSLGATLYYAIEGRPPFGRPSVAESLAALLAGPPDPPLRPGPLHTTVTALLTADPDHRPGVPDLRAALRYTAVRAIGVHAVPAPGPRRSGRWRSLLAAAAVSAVAAGVGSAAVAWAHTGPGTPRSSVTAATVTPAACAGTPEALTYAGKAPVSLPDGWGWHGDAAGFALPVPRGWQRTTTADGVCFSDPGGSRSFTVQRGGPVDEQPLQHWQTAERTALGAGTLPGYRKVSMGLLLVTGGGADWEYTWQPAGGPRLHTYRVIQAAGTDRSYALSWTTRDSDWALDSATQRTFLTGFRGSSTPIPMWTVPGPGR
jgi:tRNA A-37 threonylcarbamoyl transferase component Bud32